MKFKFILSVLIFQYTVSQEPPKQQLSTMGFRVNTECCMNVCTDPVCAPTALIACCTYNVCNLPYPYAGALGGGVSCGFLAWATEADSSKFQYYSIKTLAALKNGFVTLFPCMQDPTLVTLIKQKTE